MKTPDRTLRAEASAWIAKLHGPERSPDLEEDFRAWLEADPERARAFEHITEIWESIGSVNVGGIPRLALRDDFEPRRHWVPLVPVVAASAIAAIAVASWMLLTRGQYSTDIGEQRIVTLDEGSRLHLNSDTKLDVNTRGAVRRVQLERGEAFFEVARNRSRPFIVIAGDRTVTALGTSFVVRFDPNRTAVTLVEGKVKVTSSSTARRDAVPPPAAVGSTPTSSEESGRQRAAGGEVRVGERLQNEILLSPGQRITFDPSGSAQIDIPRADATAAWRRGEVVLDETPLSAAVAEMNRYQRQQLVVEDADIGTLPISGIYRTGDSQDFAKAVATVYNLEVSAAGDDIRLRRRH